jgi:hypothetical protein
MQALGIYTDKWALFDESSEPQGNFFQNYVFAHEKQLYKLPDEIKAAEIAQMKDSAMLPVVYEGQNINHY